mmetsp:Transcript_19483/g.29945  ORF Transcript_19483/g.29945 Transcript_19483/m.29945 type:complete len:145 (-) Transcript_19483:674-1108(-)
MYLLSYADLRYGGGPVLGFEQSVDRSEVRGLGNENKFVIAAGEGLILLVNRAFTTFNGSFKRLLLYIVFLGQHFGNAQGIRFLKRGHFRFLLRHHFLRRVVAAPNFRIENDTGFVGLLDKSFLSGEFLRNKAFGNNSLIIILSH